MRANLHKIYKIDMRKIEKIFDIDMTFART